MAVCCWHFVIVRFTHIPFVYLYAINNVRWTLNFWPNFMTMSLRAMNGDIAREQRRQREGWLAVYRPISIQFITYSRICYLLWYFYISTRM